MSDTGNTLSTAEGVHAVDAPESAPACPWWCRWHAAGHTGLDHETDHTSLVQTPATNSVTLDGRAPYVEVGLYADYGESDPMTAPSVAVAICADGVDDGEREAEVYLTAADARRIAAQLGFLADMLDGAGSR